MKPKTQKEWMNAYYEERDQRRIMQIEDQALADLESFKLKQQQEKDSAGNPILDLYSERMAKLKRQPEPSFPEYPDGCSGAKP